jgi:hypothetical protein
MIRLVIQRTHSSHRQGMITTQTRHMTGHDAERVSHKQNRANFFMKSALNFFYRIKRNYDALRLRPPLASGFL